jgi:hypothetical protein
VTPPLVLSRALRDRALAAATHISRGVLVRQTVSLDARLLGSPSSYLPMVAACASRAHRNAIRHAGGK